ncbi:killer cell lectin-like receptor subfamily B member 1B allele B isoform X2 [Phyllobates terribilis]|uniref:killer cell lectin-like receptor subfamily B member 1B allele B isoform X2 n=1 Tax=Phyllobates terribilis TaxID=111132 RepID=UPI003CCB6455
MEQVTYSKLNLKKNPRHPPKTQSAEEDVPSVVYADIRTALSQSHLPAEDPVPEVQKKILMRCSYKTLSRVLILIVVLFFCSLGSMVYHHIKEKDINQQPYENKTGSSGCLLCPSNWRLHGDHCYYYSEVTDRTWNQSQDDCKMMGADLLVIKNLDQKEIIQRSITQQVEKTYWIGLHRDGDVWRWVDGEHYSSSLFQIKIQGSGRCISMTGSGYYQGNCNSTNRWICVKKAMRI